MEEVKYEVSDKQFEFLRTLRADLDPLDENADSVLVKVLTDREYNDFQKKIIRDLRARWIREQGLHHKDAKYEDQLNNTNRT